MDIQSLTLGELAKVEELAAAPISWFGNDDKPQGKLLAALAFVIKRREDLNFTFKDAMDLRTDEIQNILGLEEDESDGVVEDEESPKED